MNTNQRISLIASEKFCLKNKKLQTILENRESFLDHIELAKKSLPASVPLLDDDEHHNKMVEGRDISVCVRVRPMLPYEVESGYFPCMLANNPSVMSFEPKIDVRGNPRPVTSKFNVDFAFDSEVTNSKVYESVTMPLIDLGLKGGVCTMLAYGQTGSGKTHTISGILERIGNDLFLKIASDHDGHMKVHLSFFELLGNEVTDLLDEQSAKKLEILEDKFGKINVKNATEIEVQAPEDLNQLLAKAFQHRQTKSTFKNDTSSRSHAVCSLRIENTQLKSAEDGKIFIIDLAGSENAADAQFHDRERVKEQQLINKSLMAMKDCIRNRALSAMNLDSYYHIPYRQSRLTLLLKDAFEIESHRHCKTVVIACVSPSCADVAMSMNTLRYVAPIKIGQSSRVKVDPNPRNPANWSNEKLKDWVTTRSKGSINPEVLCPFESGIQLLRLPETEFLERVMKSNPSIGEKRAKLFYTSLWKLLIDARTKERKDKLKRKERKDEFILHKELLARIEKDNNVPK